MDTKVHLHLYALFRRYGTILNGVVYTISIAQSTSTVAMVLVGVAHRKDSMYHSYMCQAFKECSEAHMAGTAWVRLTASASISHGKLVWSNVLLQLFLPVP